MDRHLWYCSWPVFENNSLNCPCSRWLTQGPQRAFQRDVERQLRCAPRYYPAPPLRAAKALEARPEAAVSGDDSFV